MARKPRQISQSGFYHLMCRGVNKKKLFHRAEDHEYFKALLLEHTQKLGISLFHYCLMTNHVHLLLHADEIKALSLLGHFIQRRYAYYYCKTHAWSEQVFRGRFLSIPIERDSYLLECGRYIERNPLKAGLATEPEGYPYSSYSYYAMDQDDLLLTENPLYVLMAKSCRERMAAYRFYVTQPRDNETQINTTF